MKLLITGANSYIGGQTAAYLQAGHQDWEIHKLSVRDDAWKEHSFSAYDAVFHVAGLAHKKITPENEPQYFKINRDLSVEVAAKAKKDGVKHFVFMSSMSVYSDKTERIDADTPPCPDNAYGLSKLQAEQGIGELADKSFTVSILRPPMIYGKGCKGNYQALRKLALTLPVFPRVKNRRSMLYIDNLSEFVSQLLASPQSGVFFPQNAELVNTSDWAKAIAAANGKRLYLSGALGACALIGKHVPGVGTYCEKAFGDSFYEPALSAYAGMDYQKVSFVESILRTEQ